MWRKLTGAPPKRDPVRQLCSVSSPRYCGELNARFQSSFQTSRTPFTVFPLTRAFVAQISGMAGTFEVISLSTAAHAFLRSSGAVIAAALSMASLTSLSLKTAQFELLIGMIAFPLNGTYR